MSQLNIELFKKIRNRIATVPESYNQSELYAKDESAPCGTVCCIAGEAIICNEPTVRLGITKLRHLHEDLGGYAVSKEAIRLLGLTTDDPDNRWHPMFDGGGISWPDEFQEMFGRAESREEQAEAAVAYLDYIIQTGKVD